MGGFFGMLATLFGKLGTFTSYIAEGVGSVYEGLGTSQKLIMYLFILLAVLVVYYVFTLFLRFSFKFSTRKLKNVRREYQITLNRAIGVRSGFIWDILLYQKIVIMDDPLLPKEEDKQVLLTV